jgi:hypothetical protein
MSDMWSLADMADSVVYIYDLLVSEPLFMPITDHSTWTPTTLIPRVGLRPSSLNTRERTFGRVMMEKYLLSTPVRLAPYEL